MIKYLKKLSVAAFTALLYCGIFVMIFNGISAVPVLSNQTAEAVEVPIIMYHSILKDTSRSGKYIVTPSTVTNDIKYLKANGYTFVSVEELINYTMSQGELPEKPVMLTFDDGCYNNYGYIKPILEKYDAKAVFSIVGSYTDEYSKSNIANMTYGYMRWTDIYDLFLSSRIEVGNHSYDFHSNDKGRNGAMKKSGEDSESYKNIFRADTEKMQNRCMEKTGFTPYIYTYPFGSACPESEEVLKEMGFKSSLSCNEGVNLITRDPECLFMLKRYNRPSDINTGDFFAKIKTPV